MRIVFKALLVLASIFMAYLCYSSIMSPIEFNEQKDIRDNAVIKRLKDIRKAQIAYKDLHGKYTASFDTLVYFVNNEHIPVVKKIGELSDYQLEKGLTDSIALKMQPEDAAKYGIEDYDLFMSTFRRDTSYVSVKEAVFGKGYVLDSLSYVPFSNGKKFELKVGEQITKSGTVIPLFEAKAPFAVYLQGLNKQEVVNLIDKATTLEKYEGLKVGDAEASNNNAGNWE